MICASYIYLYAIKSFRKEDGKCPPKSLRSSEPSRGGEDPIEWARAKGVGGIAPIDAYQPEVP